MSYVKHNKIKNTGILYELLSRQITVDVINDTKSPKSVKLFKEFFNKNTELGKEYELYSILLNKKYKNLTHASSLLEAVVKSRRKLSNRRLANEKYNLIKTIKENYDIKEFFNTRIPNFKVMASVYRVFQSEVGKEDFGPVQKTDSSITITEHITQTKLNEFIDSEVVKIKRALKSLLPKVNDKITKIKLSEAIDYTDTATKGKIVKDKHVVALMRYYELIKEIKNVQTRQSNS